MSTGRYVFGGQAVAVAANIRRIRDEPVRIDTCFEGSAALSEIGGCSRSHSPAREIGYPGYGLILAFESASASITGDFISREIAFEQTRGQRLDEKSPARIVAKTRVTELNVQNRLLIDHLSSQVTATFARDANRTFEVQRQARIDGVTVDNLPLTIHFNYQLPARTEEFQAATIVERLSFDCGAPYGVTTDGNALFVPELGTVFFGEVLLDRYGASLTLVRLKLGSPCGCEATVGYSRPGGVDV